MRLADVVSFRKDLLFNGAVQLGWLESDAPLAAKAAEHYAFHGPSYHGVAKSEDQRDGHQLLDTASFTLDLLRRITGRIADEPFAMAVAGYGTGKSHLGVTLALLLGELDSPTSKRVLANLRAADSRIADDVEAILRTLDAPFLVVAINGMRDFDLTAEIVRQVTKKIREKGLDTAPLEVLRPRFRLAANFVESLFEHFKGDFEERFGEGCLAASILERLEHQEEQAFELVNVIHERRLGSPIRAAGQESLHEFLATVKDVYCGDGKPFKSVLLIFDEFGRYMEFAVQRPQIAGPGALQQLFEAVQANSEGVFLLCFIQYELAAYVSRVASELRDDLQRYVTRFDSVRRVRLSSNLETLIASLLEKVNIPEVCRRVELIPDSPSVVQEQLLRWFPETRMLPLWSDLRVFNQVIVEGCWPFHPLTVWSLCKLASVGRSLQQRSALSLMADAYASCQGIELKDGWTIAPVGLCSDSLVAEFLSSERVGQQRAAAHAYSRVVDRYQHLLSSDEIRVLKATVMLIKVGVQTTSRDDCLQAISAFAGLSLAATTDAVRVLEREKGALSWNEALKQFDIVSDAVHIAEFTRYLADRVAGIPSAVRARLFCENFARWFPELEILSTDFGVEREIYTREWNYRVSFANVELLASQIDLAVRNWVNARRVDEPKGQLIYCYVGGDSDLSSIRSLAETRLRNRLEQVGVSWEVGAPIAVCFLNDEHGKFGEKVAEYWVLQESTPNAEMAPFTPYVPDRRSTVEQELRNGFEELRRARHLVFATGQVLEVSLLSATLTQLFEKVYSECIPFPFDGFSTAGGNAARDCQLFTRELFLGRLDKNWISATAPRQRNRAYSVLDASWGAIQNNGSIRLRPANQAVCHVIDLLDARLAGAGEESVSEPLNLGQIVRQLCLPPYGCNIASAGLLLALFVSARKETLTFLKSGRQIGVENWLQIALPSNYLDLSVLDNTVIIKVAEEEAAQWRRLLGDWENETTHTGKVRFLRQSEQLNHEVPVPQALYYWYENLKMQAHASRSALKEFDDALEKALRKVESGAESEDFSILSWGAADLANLYSRVCTQEGQWTEQQLREVEHKLAAARVQVINRFDNWWPHQTANSLAELPRFVTRMGRVAQNLEALGLTTEKRTLERHVESVRTHVEFIGEVQSIVSRISAFVQNGVVNASVPMSSLDQYLVQIGEFTDSLRNLRLRRVTVVARDLDTAEESLRLFRRKCQDQADSHRRRAQAVYDAQIASIDDLYQLRSEVASLIEVFAGRERDLADLRLVQRQLDRIEEHYAQLNNSDALTDAEFDALVGEIARQTESEFGEDGTPLDNESAYLGIANTIKRRRHAAAANWISTFLPTEEAIQIASAQQVSAWKSRLQSPPGYLSADQALKVKRLLDMCERRLDDLDVEGLIVRFLALSASAKKAFLARLREIG